MHITVSKTSVKHGPRRFGVNVEIQDEATRSNLWDFLSDSGVNCVRTFHPEQSMRKESPQPGGLGQFTNWDDFLNFRQNVCADPESGPIRWDSFRFNEAVPWMGIPNEFLAKYESIGIDAMVSIGTGPGDFEQSLLPDLEATSIPPCSEWNPEAAAVLYEYAFATIYHCAKHFQVRLFMTLNEPEWAPRFFHIPARFKDIPKVPLIREVQPGFQRTADGDAYRRSFGIQFGAMAHILRMAIDDVQQLLSVELMLSGPTSNQFFGVLSEYGGSFLDILDFHHYSDEVESHQVRIDEATELCSKQGNKSLAISEFNLRAGPTPFEKMMFVMPAALQQAQVLLTAIQAGTGKNPLDYLALYLFSGPSTHRSFKHLVYGDLNMLSWDGLDTALRSKGAAWYPRFTELQLRHCTPAYHIFKALARSLVTTTQKGVPLPVTDQIGPYQVMAAQTATDLFVNFVNPLDADALAALADHQIDSAAEVREVNQLCLQLPPAMGKRWVVVRRTASGMSDQLVGIFPVTDDSTCMIPDAAQSFTQARVTSLDPGKIQSIQLTEITQTPGNTTSLALFETTRLRAIDGQGNDLSDSFIEWTSSHPHLVSVSSTGLLQRLRADQTTVMISARVYQSSISASCSIGP